MADKEIIVGRVINVTGMAGVSAGIVLVAEASRVGHISRRFAVTHRLGHYGRHSGE
jgi:hypothetical protein